MKAPKQSDNPTIVTKLTPSVAGSEAAPTIYFDNVVACGLLNGVVQLELVANCLVPIEGQPQPRVRTVVVAHLRCSGPAAQSIADMAQRALSFGQQPAAVETPPPAAKKLSS